MDTDVAAIAAAAEDAASPEDWSAMVAVMACRDTEDDRDRLRRLVVLVQAHAHPDETAVDREVWARRTVAALRGKRLPRATTRADRGDDEDPFPTP